MIIEANLVDILNRKIYPAQISIKNDKIFSIKKIDKKLSTYILPGFIDAHIHIESSMLIPSRFAQIAVSHGTVACVCDPHEIANVLGVKGVDFMIEDGKKSGFKFYFGASPCVPATFFETSGAVFTPKVIEELLKRDDIYFLSEVMNYPGVINKEKDILKKIALAKKYKKPIDGHAPSLRGEALNSYIKAGIQTDHEAITYEEAKEKLQKGMKIIIREGSAAKNFEALSPLIEENYENLMFCSDDKHPNDLVKSHINELVKRALKKGYDLFKVLQIACINPVFHYNLDVGILREGDFADFIEVEDLKEFNIKRVTINGKILYENGQNHIQETKPKNINNFFARAKKKEEFFIKKCEKYQIIKAIDKSLLTDKETAKTIDIPDIKNDILLLTVANRYEDKKPSTALIKGFSLKKGALASSVAHDSHNIIALGTNYEDLQKAVNIIIENKGGICAVDGGKSVVLPLEIAGLMSKKDGKEVAKIYQEAQNFAFERGCKLTSPFMTLSFMALLVIPKLKLSDKGLFDGEKFDFTDLCL